MALSSETKHNYLYTGKEFLDNFGLNWYDHHARYFDPEVGRWWAIDPALQGASPYMAMGNNPMMYTDADGRTWDIFKAMGQAWDYAWDKGNQFAQWADKVGIPSFNVGVGMNSGGQISPLVNGQAINNNPYGSDQNVITGINNARMEYFGQQQMNANYSQLLNDRIMSIPYSTVPRNKNDASNGGGETNLGLYIASGAFGFEDIYNNFGHNHTSYPTTKATMKNFSDFAGRKMSKQALKYSSLSKNVKWAGNFGTGLMVFQSGYNYYYKSDRSALNYIDGGVGLMGLGNAAVTFITGAGSVAIGPFVALYGGVRLMMDASAGERMRIRDNIMNNRNPLNNVYNPSLGF